MPDDRIRPSPEITALLDAWNEGDSHALESLIPLVMKDLKRMAALHLAKENAGHTLQATALVHEVYLRLSQREQVDWQDREHFFATLGTLMRRILVDHARRKSAEKKGGGVVHLSFDEVLGRGAFAEPRSGQEEAIMALDSALQELGELDSRQTQVVELRFFAGLTIDETSRAMRISPMTVKREWRLARLWLLRRLEA